jgi:hypothetical protein
MYAIVKAGGHQEKVSVGSVITVNRLGEKQGEEVQFVMVNLTDGSRETVAGVTAFIAQLGYSFPVYYDTAGSAAAAYGISSIPTTIFIDAEGNVVSHAVGAINAQRLQQGIEQILAGR